MGSVANPPGPIFSRFAHRVYFTSLRQAARNAACGLRDNHSESDMHMVEAGKGLLAAAKTAADAQKAVTNATSAAKDASSKMAASAKSTAAALVAQVEIDYTVHLCLGVWVVRDPARESWRAWYPTIHRSVYRRRSCCWEGGSRCGYTLRSARRCSGSRSCTRHSPARPTSPQSSGR